jgi:hypothetical protein
VKHPVPNVPGLLWRENPSPAGRAVSNVVGIVEIDTLATKANVTLRAVSGSGTTLHAETILV